MEIQRVTFEAIQGVSSREGTRMEVVAFVGDFTVPMQFATDDPGVDDLCNRLFSELGDLVFARLHAAVHIEKRIREGS